MKFWQKILVFLAGLLVLAIGLRLILESSHILKISKISNIGNEPALKINKTIVASRFKNFKKLDFVLYYASAEDSDTPGLKETQMYCHRMIADEGDVLEIKDGRSYVNGKLQNINIALPYLCNLSEIKFLHTKMEFNQNNSFDLGIGEKVVFLDDDFVKTNKMTCKRFIQQDQQNYLHESFKKPNWTSSNMGPITIPKDYIFALGDNRLNSLDSRFFGFIPKDKVIATKL
jgi:signal peptidase I